MLLHLERPATRTTATTFVGDKRAQTTATPSGPIRAAVNRFTHGSDRVDCEECGAQLRAHHAVWRGQHPYCSTAHEAADTA